MDRKEFLQESLYKYRTKNMKFTESLRNMPIDMEDKARITMDPIMGMAIKDSNERDKRIEKDFAEQNKAKEALIKWQEDARDGKMPKIDGLKKMHLQESLFESLDEELGLGAGIALGGAALGGGIAAGHLISGLLDDFDTEDEEKETLNEEEEDEDSDEEDEFLKSIQDFLIKSVKNFYDNDEDSCAIMPLNDNLYLCVGFEEGVDPADGDVIHEEDNPEMGLFAGIKVSTDEVPELFDDAISPCDEDGEELTEVAVIGPADAKDGFIEVATFIKDEFEKVKDINFAENGLELLDD